MKKTSEIHIIHPEAHSVVLRTELDWDRDVQPNRIENDGEAIFVLESEHAFLQLKACLLSRERLLWNPGPNKVVLMGCAHPRIFYPYFHSTLQGSIGALQSLRAKLGRSFRFRVYLPPGYDENHRKRYPVLYMHDGANLFFPEEAFGGVEWQVDETLDGLSALSLIDQTIVVALYAEERSADYTAPGYHAYGDFVSDELKPWIDDRFRTLPQPASNLLVGSSLGGVVAFFLAWQRPDVFGGAACLSATFGYRDQLIERVLSEPVASRGGLRLYLDSGWPADNYEATLSMAMALDCRGFTPGNQYLYLVHPLAQHSETAWSQRLHIPVQFLTGQLTRVDHRNS